MSKLLLVAILILIVPVNAHEDHNEIFTPDGYFWTWDSSLETNDAFTWSLQIWDYGVIINEGKIDIEVIDNIAQSNLLEYFSIDDNITFNEYTNRLFDIEFSEDISYYSTVYFAKHMIAPVIFYQENGDRNNLLSTTPSEEFVYIGLINETIDLTCIQGCHTEDLIPFSTNWTNSYMNDDMYIIEGVFNVNDFPGSDLYGYDTGTFKAVYYMNGVLDNWLWESSDGLEKLIITKNDISSRDIQMIYYFIGIPMIVIGIAVIYIVKVVLPKIKQPIK